MKKIFVYYVIFLSILLYLLIIIFNYKIDPLGLNSNQEYYINDAGYSRYQNIGIAKHKQYETMIVGTSLSENFKATLCDKVFNTKTIKIPMSGASAKEQNILVSNAISKNTKRVIWDIHYTAYYGSNDRMHENMQFPLFLYDDDIVNDLKFYASFDTFRLSIKKSFFIDKYYTKDFDTLYNWYLRDKRKFGNASVSKYIKNLEKKLIDYDYNKEYSYSSLKENLDKNILPIILANKSIEFNFYFPPYTKYYFLGFHKTGLLDDILMFKKYFIEKSLEYHNMKIHDFSIDYKTLENLDNYKDTHHYSQYISDHILKTVKTKSFLVGDDWKNTNINNYKKYLTTELEKQ